MGHKLAAKWAKIKVIEEKTQILDLSIVVVFCNSLNSRRPANLQ
jgi:hypothetical protein